MTISTTDQPPLGNQSEPQGQIGAVLNLAYVVRSVQNELGDYSMHQYKRLMQLAIDGMRFLNLFHNPCIQVVYGQVNDAGIFPFPNDYVAYNKIGIYCHGRLITLTLNNKMALNRAQQCAEDIRVMESNSGWALIDDISDGYFFSPHYWGGNYIGGLYGVGGGINTAYYRVDEQARQVQFNGYIPNDKRIVMEYQSSGISEGTIIGPQVIESLKKYIQLYRVKYKGASMSSIEMMERDLDKAVSRLRAFNGRFTLEEHLDVMYASRKQSPKI